MTVGVMTVCLCGCTGGGLLLNPGGVGGFGLAPGLVGVRCEGGPFGVVGVGVGVGVVSLCGCSLSWVNCVCLSVPRRKKNGP